jgi:hypothetical protein
VHVGRSGSRGKFVPGKLRMTVVCSLLFLRSLVTILPR